ncbi:Uncharacterised protein [Vibrio cholerae]|nr:Uncharacterised protein [Vibrio cholerae]
MAVCSQCIPERLAFFHDVLFELGAWGNRMIAINYDARGIKQTESSIAPGMIFQWHRWCQACLG